MTSFKWFLLLCFFVCISITAHSQQAGYKLYTIDDGLAQSEVTSLFQDSKGFIWIGTKSGISRFDGHAFRTISDTAGVSKSWVTDIFQLNDSTLVFASRNGITLFSYGSVKDQVKSFRLPERILCSWVREETLWHVTLENSLPVLYQIKWDGMERVNHSFLDQIADKMQLTGMVNIAISPRDGNMYFRTKEGKLACLRKNGDIRTLPVHSFGKIFKGNDDALYVSTPEGVLSGYLSNDALRHWTGYSSRLPESVKFFRISDTSLSLVADLGMNEEMLESSVLIVNQKKIFFSTPEHPYILLMEDGKWWEARLDFAAVNALLCDREGNLWVGSPMGLIKVFSLALTHFDEKDGLYSNLQCILEDLHGTMIAGGYEKGLQRLVNGRFLPISYPPMPELAIPPQVYPGGGRDREGILHICMNPCAYLLWDGQKCILPYGLPVLSSISFYEDTATLTNYYGTTYGLMSQQQGKEGYRMQDISPGGKGNKTVALMQDGKGRLLLGGFQGLSMMEGDSVMPLPTAEFPYAKGANAMVRDSWGNVWIGNTDGLWHFDNDTFRKIENPWFDGLVVSLAVVDSSMLFIGGIHGMGFLSLTDFYHSDTARIRYFNSSNGFNGRECQQNAVCVNRQGIVWVATTSNLMRIDPNRLPDELPGPQTYITSVSVIDDQMQSVPLVSTALTKESLTLDHQDHNIRFDYTAVWFRAPEFVWFRYRLTGQDAVFSPPTKERFSSYTNLAPGIYTFEVIACNENGNWTEHPATLTIHIRPAFWQTWWFFLFAVVLAAGFVSGGTWLVFRRSRLKKQKELIYKQTVAELQFRTFRNQLAPHFIFNALNAIGSTIYRNELKLSYDLLHKFSKLIRSTLVHAEKTSRKLGEEIEFVSYYLEIEKIRFDRKISYNFSIGEKVSLDQQVPRMIIQTFVENSVKHGLMYKEGDGHIAVDVSQLEDCLLITVEDNGIGRDAATRYRGESTGKGMEIIREFIRLFNTFNPEKISVEVEDLFAEGEASGTRVLVKLPVNYTYTLNNAKEGSANRFGG
ncbi:MAG: histidine kinase [Bacteroidales bacterium]|nr:histidine kinase [Bacteroidales bacterium]